MLKKVDAESEIITTSAARIAALENELKTLDEENTANRTAKEKALLELGELRATVAFNKQAITEAKEQIATLWDERDKERKDNKHLRRENLILKLVLVGGSIALRYL